MKPGTAAPHAAESFWEQRETFKQRVRRYYRLSLGEQTGAYQAEETLAPLNERLLQLIWANQMFSPEGLRLVDGRPVRVLDPGRWNGAGGPDFQAARLMIGEESVRGDIEMHLDASGWRAHGHERDLDYNGVALHVVLRNDDGRTEDRLHNGGRLPRLELDPYLFPDLATIRRSVGPDDFQYARPSSVGRCHEVMTAAAPEELGGFLDRAGEERLLSKVRRLEDQLERADVDQVFYQSLMSSLGTSAGKPLYYLLAKRAPLDQLRREARGDAPGSAAGKAPEIIESILLHVAGLMPEAQGRPEGPEESRAHAARLAELWAPLAPYWAERMIPPTRRWYRGIRPVNFPPRRLAAVSMLLARSFGAGSTPLRDLRRIALELAPELEAARPGREAVRLARRLAAGFELEPDGHFWETHYSFEAEPADKAMRLIGEGAARSLAFNAGLPALMLLARLEGDETLAGAVRRFYEIFPPLSSNHILDFMGERLFGKDGVAAGLIGTERRQQGLFQIFHSCCNGEELHCDCCYYLEGSAKGWPLTAG